MKHILRYSLVLSALCAPLPAAITYTVSFTANADAQLTSAERAIFQDGMAFWDEIIDGHQDNANRNWNLTVDTFSEARDPDTGVITLGSAGPDGLIISGVVPGSGLSAPFENRFILSENGQASFNTHPDAGALDPRTIRHEIGHALGIGTLWEDNEVYNDGDSSTGNRTAAGGTPGQYVGANALAAYQLEYDALAAFIPVELDGGGGTAHGHWNEVADNPSMENSPGPDGDPGDGDPAPTDTSGNSLDDELMTGLLSGSAYLSNTSTQSLIDLGFTLEAVPEPSSALLCLSGLLLLGRRRR